MKKSMVALSALSLFCAAQAKLPPPSDEAKAKAEETKAKAAWSDKVAAYHLCLAQNKVADYYRKHKKDEPKQSNAAPAAKQESQSAAAMAPCQDPGPYVPAQQAAVGAADASPVPTAGKLAVEPKQEGK